jgi:nicotinamidase-related amidase
MSTRGQAARTALVVIDVQNAVMADAWDRDGVISRIATLVERAHTEQAPVLFIQHDEPASDDMQIGMDGWKLVDALAPRPDDIVIAKQYPDAFVETDLAETLEDLDVGHLVIAGAQTDACIRATFHRALVEGFDVTIVRNCHTTSDRALEGVTITGEQIVAHMNIYAPYTVYPGRTSSTAQHDEVVLATSATAEV